MAGIVTAVNFVKCPQPRLTALLAHDAVHTPGGKSVVESFVGAANGFFLWRRLSSGVELRQVAIRKILCGRLDPGIASAAQRVPKTF